MPASIVVGTQWGDEGKGKVTDYLADHMRFVVRYQGGNNAGHTVVAEGQLLKLHLVPSGILYPHLTSVIADGVVVDPGVLLEEMDTLSGLGIDVSRLVVSGNAHLIMPYHLELEKVTERHLGKHALDQDLQPAAALGQHHRRGISRLRRATATACGRHVQAALRRPASR